MPTAGQRADDQPVAGVEIIDHAARHSAQPTGHPMTLDGVPTDFDTTRPILGASVRSPADRRECTTKSGWAARTPWLTVSPKSVDRVIRY